MNADEADIRAAAAEIVKAAVARWITPGYYPHVECVGHINMGPCAEFAEEVVGELLERFPECDARIVDTIDVLDQEGRESHDYHAFVCVAGRYFDATATDGVASPLAIDMVYRIWKNARTSDGADDEQEHDIEDCDEVDLPRP